jgi:hypothetical protein
MDLAPAKAVAATAVTALTLLTGGILAGPAIASPTGVHPAATKGIVFTYPNGSKIVVDKACKASNGGTIPAHDKQQAGSATNDCSSVYLIIVQRGLCGIAYPGKTLGLTPGFNPYAWAVYTDPICP